MTVRANRTRIATAAIAATVGLSGCSVGLQDLPLGAGGRNAFDVTAELVTADGLVSGADVRHGQQIVGRVTDMRLEERHAEITMTIADGTDLPANTTLNVELPSALGTPFVRLSEPEEPEGRLTEGSHLDLSDTGVGPQIESTLAALGNILGGSGVSQLQSVMSSLNTAFENRSDKVGDLIDTLNRLLARSSKYTDDFNAAMAEAADVSELLVAQQQTVDDFLGQVPQAVNVLAAQRDQIAKLMSQTTRLTTNVAAITRGRQETLNHLVGDAEQMVKSLSAFNTEVGSTLDNMNAFMKNFDRAIRGDYLVFDGSLDIPGGIDKILTGGLLLAGGPLPTPDDLRNVLSGGLANTKPKKTTPTKTTTPTPSPPAGAPR
ncbi:MCE family protein [Gordonia westfalica]|uniref:Phospholipid/cholesterol/gamma-HCH transport system substrate-binding protein n=1 Tax=Gordonia westfalica TaxID=158898 RepID=A0A1H2JII3_9ACTN|nr:MCE family protein [Gordonia westfalica]SDU56334.1 phospholipid/cholesterol/gamma-HCH transport system substrate-binding protein [Gordonia westfalica]